MSVLEDVRGSIEEVGWYRFGLKDDCPGLVSRSLEQYLKDGKLPTPCDTCYKALVFGRGFETRKGLTALLSFVESFGDEYRGKFNYEVLIFYFRDRDKLFEFLYSLKDRLGGFEIVGGVQWRKACKEYQRLRPELWKSAKELM